MHVPNLSVGEPKRPRPNKTSAENCVRAERGYPFVWVAGGSAGVGGLSPGPGAGSSQMGEDQARSCSVACRSGRGSTPRRKASHVDQRHDRIEAVLLSRKQFIKY